MSERDDDQQAASVDVPDDLSSLTGPPPRSVVVLPPLQPAAAARVCAVAGTGGHLVPQPGCLLLVLQPGGEQALAVLSKALRRAELVQLQLSDDYLTATRWRRGAPVGRPEPAGLLAQSLPDATLALVRGTQEAADLPGAVPVGEATGSGLLRRLLGG